MVADAAVVVVVALHALPVFAIDLRHTFLPRDLLYLEPISYLFALATMTSLLVHVLAMTVRVVVSTVLSHVGIASVSLYVEPIEDAYNSGLGLRQVGTSHLFGLEADDVLITVVGDVPAITVRKIAKSVSQTASRPDP